MMLLAWVCMRDRSVVTSAAAGMANGRFCSREEKLPDGRHVMAESPADPVTPLWLTSFIALQRAKLSTTSTMMPYDAKAEITRKLSDGLLTASGLKNGAGDRQLIPSQIGWIRDRR
jgi:hypothetical protein